MLHWILWFVILNCEVNSQESIGCFQSTGINDPDFPDLVAKRINSPSECNKECSARYYMFSGLMSGSKCYCGSRYGRAGPSNNCTETCIEDKHFFCGSKDAISVYTTGQKASSPPRDLNVIKRNQDSLEVSWQPPIILNGEIFAYTVQTVSLESPIPYPLLPTETEVLGKDSNVTKLLGLHPGTKYNISIRATNTNFNYNNIKAVSEPSYIIGWTLIGPPEKPEPPRIVEKTENTITIDIPEGKSENGPLTYYNVIVARLGIVPPVGSDIVYERYDKAVQKGHGYYIAGRFHISDYERYKRFVVGDEGTIGGYYNPSLDTYNNGPAQVGIALESRVRGEYQFSYSDLVASVQKLQALKDDNESLDINITNIILWVMIVVLTGLLITSIIVFLVIKKKFEKIRMRKLPEQQELTLQGPMYEIDNMAYIPEDMPERQNHYQDLKSKVWIIPRNFLNFNPTLLRRGRFGDVHTGTVLKDGIPIAVFVHKISDRALKNSEKRLMLRELDTCIKAGCHRYLAGLVGNCETPDTLFVAMEMPAQCLKTRLLAARSGEDFPYIEILRIGSRIADALHHLASLNIVHSSVCARSVGLSEIGFIPKLMGHGLSKYELEDIKYARWTAIECFEDQKKRHQPGVVWAFGVLMWEMFSFGGTPYADLEMDSDVEEALHQGRRLAQLGDIPDPIFEVMNSCWFTSPSDRPTFNELIRLDTLTVCPITAITEPYRPDLELN